ncbi:MAG: hypothetical protein K9H64_15740, partial [Bacteroidales bacterium]|nr:hypothetical protein [Bacteroidales bacterium]MCF8458946.1 hypothetical protein [Bacteroidales bacterium]
LMAPAQRQLFYPIYEIEQQKSIVHYTPESLYILLRNRCTLYSGIFTECLGEEDWLLHVGVYIINCAISYGTAYHGMQVYYEQLIVLVENDETLYPEEQKELTDLFERQLSGNGNDKEFTKILSIYNDWLELWKPNIELFREVRRIFEGTISIFCGKPLDSSIEGETAYELLSHADLLTKLKSITREILSRLSYRSELINKVEKFDATKTKIDLQLASWELSVKNLGINANKDDWDHIIDLFSDWYKIEKENINEILPMVSEVNKYLHRTDKPSVFRTDISFEQLSKIFARLCQYRICKSNDLGNWLALFKGETQGRVYWDDNVIKSKALLFDLMYRLTGTSPKSKDLKPHFITNKVIIMNWKDKMNNPTVLGDEILDGIIE